MAWVDDLGAVMPPHPGTDGTEQDWAAVEAALGVPVPPSYKAFCEIWGPGGLFGGEIVLFAPSTPDRPDRFVDEVLWFQKTYATLKQDWPERYTLPPLPLPGSLLTFAIDGNANHYGWIVGPGEPDGWEVAIHDRSAARHEVLGLDFPGFMLAIARGTLRPTLLGDFFEDWPMTLEPLTLAAARREPPAVA